MRSHIVYVFGYAQTVAFERYACRFHSLREGILAHAAIAVDVVDTEVFADVPLNGLGHGLVDTARTEASAEGKYREIVIEAELFPCLLL